jgi:hypothetical protein
MYEVKGSNDSRRGARKGQSDVPTKLAGMAQGIISASKRAGDSGATRQLGEDIRVRVTKATMPDGRGSSGS